jgi:hypothetical protein
MRRWWALAGTAVAVASIGVATAPAAACGLFSRHPCTPGVCSVFHHGTCIPDYGSPFGQDLRLTVESKAPETSGGPGDAQDNNKPDNNRPDSNKPDSEKPGNDKPDHKVDTIRQMFAALRACWVPPPQDEARPGMQLSVRFAFKRNGEIIASPRVTYVSPGVSPETRETYLQAVTAALERCTPLDFTDGMAGAIAGKPIAIRFIDNRIFPGETDGHN